MSKYQHTDYYVVRVEGGAEPITFGPFGRSRADQVAEERERLGRIVTVEALFHNDAECLSVGDYA